MIYWFSVPARTYQLLQQCRPEGQVEGPHGLAPGSEVGKDPCSEVAHLYFRTVQQGPDMIQEALYHQLCMQLAHFGYVVLNHTHTQPYILDGFPYFINPCRQKLKFSQKEKRL